MWLKKSVNQQQQEGMPTHERLEFCEKKENLLSSTTTQENAS